MIAVAELVRRSRSRRAQLPCFLVVVVIYNGCAESFGERIDCS
jgi:hypothetical protein